MAGFPHLRLSKKIDGLHKPIRGGGPREVDPTTLSNLTTNRAAHGATLLGNVNRISQEWKQSIEARKAEGLPDLPNPAIVPVFLQIDTKKFDIESLKSFGIEIIAEEEGGFIIGASGEDFTSLRTKIEKFVSEEGKFKNKASELWEINTGTQWRVDQILSDELRAKWGTIRDGDVLTVDIGIACYVRISDQPTAKNKDETDVHFRERVGNWHTRKEEAEAKRDELARSRQTDFERLVSGYGGEIISSFFEVDDSFSCRIRISGKGLRDIVLSYQYLFEVFEPDPLYLQDGASTDIEAINPELVAPDENAPRICIIDSGIQENHRLLAPAIDASKSRSFVPTDATTADIAPGGGHGTKVAGAALYPYRIPKTGRYELPFYLQNAKVMTTSGTRSILPESLYPPTLMEKIVAHFEGTRIFNMSINAFGSCRVIHMSPWAAAIDKLMSSHNLLFILSAGNINTSGIATKPGIQDHLAAGRNYPNYLLENSSRIGDPAQSSFALTVGSVCSDKFDDPLKESFGEKDDPSSFSRTGLGLWGMIKPDVVEYGGDFVKEKVTNPNISREASISPELVRSTYSGGSEVANDSVGTSFAAPRVSSIAANLQKIYPDESANLYRALIVQSARLPERVFQNPTIEAVRHFGYGIPSLNRATENTEQRVTLIASGELAAKQANVYSVKIPEQMRAPGDDFDVLIEVTLSFMARPRRTRRGTHSYLATWLNWESSKLNESYDQFTRRVIQDMEESDETTQDQNAIPWVIRENKDWSKVTGLKRQDSTLQKSWVIMKSNQLPQALNLAVIGHCGWESDLDEQVAYSIAVSFEALNGNVNVYEMIRVENEIPVEVEQRINT